MLDTTSTTTVQSLLDQSIEQDSHKADYQAPARQFSFDDQSRLVPAVENNLFGESVSPSPLHPTPWAWSQIFTKLGPTVFGKDKVKGLPSDYLLALRPEQRAGLLNDHLQGTSTNWLVRSFDDNARAVLSDKFTKIDNSHLLDILNKVAEGSNLPYSVTRNSSVNPDSLNIRIIWKDIQLPGGRGGYGIGTYIRNGETGNRRGGIFPLIQRHSCQNSIIVDDRTNAYEFLHLGNASSKLTLIKAAIVDILPFAAHLLDQFIKADAEQIPDFSDVISGLCKQYGWGESVQTRIAVGTEGRDTRFGLINGITWAAHEISNPDLESDLEIIGGSLLLAPDSVFHKAAQLAQLERRS
jgi:hypothetical protein